jgi:hypothetical protein
VRQSFLSTSYSRNVRFWPKADIVFYPELRLAGSRSLPQCDVLMKKANSRLRAGRDLNKSETAVRLTEHYMTKTLP